jgi:hypothetical protein
MAKGAQCGRQERAKLNWGEQQTRAAATWVLAPV